MSTRVADGHVNNRSGKPTNDTRFTEGPGVSTSDGTYEQGQPSRVSRDPPEAELTRGSHYQVSTVSPGIDSKCLSRVTSTRWRSIAVAAIQRSLSGIGLPAVRSCCLRPP